MSPGNRPSHFGVNPAHITNPTRVVITPMITTNLPSSRTIQKVARIERRHKLEAECLYNSEIITRHSACRRRPAKTRFAARSEEHTSELQSQSNLVCRLLL